MKQWKNFLFFAVCFFAAMSAKPRMIHALSTADMRCSSGGNWSFCGQKFVAGGDLIYWKPCISDLDYAAVVKEGKQTKVDYRRICLDCEPGFRAYLALPHLFCDWTMAASYTHLCFCDSASVRSEGASVTTPLLHPTLSGSSLYDIAKGKYGLRFHDGDLLLSCDISCKECQRFTPFIGVAGLYVDQELKTTLLADGVEEIPAACVKWNSTFWGVGLRAGAEYVHSFNECFGVFAALSGTLLGGKADNKNKQKAASEAVFRDGDGCHFVPGYLVAAGIVYNGNFCHADLCFRLGYEFLNWYNIPNHRVFTGREGEESQISNSTSSSTRTLGFHGLLAGVSLSF